MLRDILKGGDPRIEGTAKVIAHIAPDLLVMTGFDFDHGQAAISAYRDVIRQAGHDFPHIFTRRPNTGLDSGHDLDGNGRLGEARDMQGYGRFAGQGGMAILSRYPFGEGVEDFSDLLWRDLPGAILPAGFYSDEALDVLRLATTAHWDVPVILPDGELRLLAFHASPPVFDGPEDRNGRRNHDEVRFWSLYLEGKIGAKFGGPFAILGDANLDPSDGDGRGEAMSALLGHPSLQDPLPKSAGGTAAANPDHRGDPALDTADWRDEDGPGNLRVDYVLPSADLNVTGAGVFWPAPDNPLADLLTAEGQPVSRHRLVWVDVVFEGKP